LSPPTWRPSYHEAIYGREAPDSLAEARYIIEDMVSKANHFRDWTLDDTGIAVTLSGENGRIGFEANGITGEVALDIEDGWVRAVATVGGREVFRGYVERHWEEYEVWPAGATDEKAEEPGRLGKHLMWASLNSVAWPGIAAIANVGGWVNVQHDEAAMIERNRREGRTL
jgi:hypothetical protein